jgi:hypothetical protein
MNAPAGMQRRDRTIDFGKVTARKIIFEGAVNVARDVQSLGGDYWVPAKSPSFALFAVHFSLFARRQRRMPNRPGCDRETTHSIRLRGILESAEIALLTRAPEFPQGFDRCWSLVSGE